VTGRIDRAPASNPSLAMLLPPTARLIVVSPHLDDGALSCGDLLAEYPGSSVVTAFAGRPAAYPPLTSWDERAGFPPGADVVGARRQEDERALTVLDARPYWLDFPDPQYGVKPTQRDLTDALVAALNETSAGVIVVPLGLFHDDHILTSDAALDALRLRPSLVGLAYAEAIYRPLPDLLDRRIQMLRETGLVLTDVAAARGAASDLKRRAVSCYASQVRALDRSWDGGAADAFEPERYWQLAVSNSPIPPGQRPVDEGQHGDGR